MYITYSEKFHSVLVPIAKNASTSLQAWIYQLENQTFDPTEGPKGSRNLVLSVDDFLSEFGDYYKFTCVRNPVTRLVSCYLDKFVYDLFSDGIRKNRLSASVEAYQNSHNKFANVENYAVHKLDARYESGITFEMFLEAIEVSWKYATCHDRVDTHWGLQYEVGDFEKILYNKICRCECLLEDMKVIEHDLGIPEDKIFAMFKNVHRNAERIESNDYYGDICAAELSKSKIPKQIQPRNFYTYDTFGILRSKFKQDFDYFNYDEGVYK